MSTDLVLGVALSPTALGLVLIRGRRGDGPVLDRNLIDTGTADGGPSSRAASDKALDAILRTCATATGHGYRVQAIGVTSAGADADDALQLVEWLTKAGMSNVAAVDPHTASGSDAATVAAARALELTHVPTEAHRLETIGRQRHSRDSPHTPRMWVIGAAAATLVTALAAVAVATADFGSTEPRPPATIPSTAVPATAVTVARSTTASQVPSSPPFVAGQITASTMKPRTAAPTLASVTPVIPADPQAHLEGNDDGPRPPGPG